MKWKFFTEKELRCRGSGDCEMNEAFMRKLIATRTALNAPMIITSGYRSPDHNKAVGGSKNSPHMEGRAVDVVICGADALALVAHALNCGMQGIGIKQNGPHAKRFIHLDDAEPLPSRPRPWIWSY